MVEVTDLLYTMAKHGEDVSPLCTTLSLSPAQQITVQSGALPDDEGIDLVLNYLVKQVVDESDDLYLAYYHLVGLGPRAVERLQRFFERFQGNPNAYVGLEPYPGYPGYYRNRGSLTTLLRAAGATEDTSFVPTLAVLARCRVGSTGYYAAQTNSWLSPDSRMPPRLPPALP